MEIRIVSRPPSGQQARKQSSRAMTLDVQQDRVDRLRCLLPDEREVDGTRTRYADNQRGPVVGVAAVKARWICHASLSFSR